MDVTGARGTSGSWRRVVDRAVMACGVFVLAVQVAVCASALIAVAPGGDARTTTAVAGTLVVDLVLLGTSAAGVARPEVLQKAGTAGLAATVALVGVCLAATVRTPVGGPPLDIVAVNAAQAAQAAALGLVLRPVPSAGLIAATGVVFVPLRVATAGADPLVALDQWVIPATISLGVLAVLHRLRGQADEADRLGRAVEAERRAQAGRQNRDLARDEARRLIHDEVISALRAIELGVAPDAGRRAAVGALAALRGTTRLSTLSAFEDGLRSTTALDLTVDADGWRRPPPPRVLDAMAGAAGEALRNAERHGRAGRAVVRLAGDDQLARVEVHDDGSGLVDGWRPGFGISESIVGRMRAVGGEAVVRGGERGGAVVRLTWPEQVQPVRTTARALGLGPRAVLWPLAATCAVSTTYLAVRFPGASSFRGGLVALAAVALLAAVVVVLGRLRGAGRPVPTVVATVVGLAVCGLTWTGLAAAGDGALLGFRSWVVGSTANAVALLAFESRARQVVPIVLAQLAVVVGVAVHDPDVGPLQPIGALATPVVVGGLGLVLGAALRHGERRARRARRDLARSHEEAAWAASDDESRRVHLAHLEDDVVPYLRRAADGADPGATEATLLALRCRDALYLDRPLDAATRACVQAARRAGTVVTIRAGVHDTRSAWPLLRRVLADTPPGSTVTVLPGGAAGPVTGRIVVTPALADDAPARGSGGDHDAVRSTFAVTSTAAAPTAVDRWDD